MDMDIARVSNDLRSITKGFGGVLNSLVESIKLLLHPHCLYIGLIVKEVFDLQENLLRTLTVT